MNWLAALRVQASPAAFADFDLLYHAGLRPLVPPEYAVPGLVGLTFRLHERPMGGFVFVTTIDLPAALRLGERLGLDAAGAVALVDSHERVHVALQLAGAGEAEEEDLARFIDAVWLSLRNSRAAERLRSGAFGVVTHVHDGFWEALVDEAAMEPSP